MYTIGAGNGLWRIDADGTPQPRIDGSEEHHLGGRAGAPVWSPDSQALVFTQAPAGAGAFDAARVRRAQVGQWQPQALPGGAQVVQWFPPAP